MYGYLSNRNRQQRINEVLDKMQLPVHSAKVQVPVAIRMLERYGIDIHACLPNESGQALLQEKKPGTGSYLPLLEETKCRQPG